MQTEAVWRALPRKIREVLAEKDLHDLQEIRLRSGQPLLLKRENRLFSLGKEGVFLPAADEKGMRISMADLRETVSLLSGYSLYAFEEELRQGYLTIEGGHRVGFCGKAVLENGEIRTLRQINTLNIRERKEGVGRNASAASVGKEYALPYPACFTAGMRKNNAFARSHPLSE